VPPHLVLWDIDKTLVDIGPVSHDIYRTAFRRATGVELRYVPRMGGRTDHDLALTTLRAHDIESPEDRLADFYDALAQATEEHRPAIEQRGRPLPGAREILRRLAGMPAVTQSVVTGNIRPTAEQKLAAFDLAAPMNFDIGGYGSDDGDRATLVRLASRRAHLDLGIDYPATRIVIIGDTPYDVAGAKANGARVIGVATGGSTPGELQAAGADLVLPSLDETDAIIRFVTG
jgi:phosphoglycolate phosphatase-like HAD superfamily hydrolase